MSRRMLSGKGFFHAAAAGGGGSLDPATTAWVNAVTAAGGSVSNTIKSAVDAFVRSCKSTGEWSVLDRFGVFAVDDHFTADVDLVNPAITLTKSHSASGSDVTFSAGIGYIGTGTGGNADGGALHTSYVPNSGAHWSLNSAMFMAYVTNARAMPDGSVIIGASNSVETNWDGLSPRHATVGSEVSLNCGGAAASAVSPGSSQGLFLGIRSGASAQALYLNGSGTAIGTDGTTASLLSNGEVVLFAGTDSATIVQQYSSDTMAFYAIGGAVADPARFMGYVNTLATALGVNVY